MDRERDVEKRLVSEVQKRGGLAYKWVSPGADGVPDRIVIFPDSRVFFVELKSERGRLSPLQKAQIKRLLACGVDVSVVYGMAGLEVWLKEIDGVFV